jgi:tetratricopeptide (TPR) repeat protein
LVIEEKTLGKDHPDVATSLNNLAGLYDAQGDNAKALPMYVRALAINEKALGKDHPNVGIILDNYADSLEALGKTKEAAAARARAKKIEDQIDRKSGK